MTTPAPGTGAEPVRARSEHFATLVLMEGTDERRFAFQGKPFTIGRRVGNDIVVADPRVSRDHATILEEGGTIYIVDQGSKLGTYVNGERVQRHKLVPNDKIEFGQTGIVLLFDPDKQVSSAREFLTQISARKPVSGAADLETLNLFLQAARKLNTSAVLDDVLVTLLDATLQLTRAERGYVFLRDEDGSLRLAAGRNSKGEALSDDSTTSKSILRDAMSGAGEFLVTDSEGLEQLAGRQSIVAHNLRTVICIPLRRRMKMGEEGTEEGSAVGGALYLDSHFASGKLSAVSADLLRAIANEAAALVENAYLVQSEEERRRYEQELSIAASIQQQLMAVTIPDVPYARVNARSIACRAIGGDFFDVVNTDDGLAFVLTDVCGKGVTAALLASILQGMIFSQLTQNIPLVEIVATANKFICGKNLGGKYATLVLSRVSPTGELEYVNCGHIPPVIIRDGKVIRLRESNLPVGLIPVALYESAKFQLEKGDRFIVVTDGVTEAEDATGEFFGDHRLEEVACISAQCDDILSSVRQYAGGVPFNDDCTILEVAY